MRVLFFGTYDVTRHPRVRVLKEGLTANGHDVAECNAPLGFDTARRVRVLEHPWLVPVFALRLVLAWSRLWWRSRRLAKPDVVIVGYLGHLDVRLARLLWPRVPIVLDHMVSLYDTAVDRGARSRTLRRVLRAVDEAALRRAELVCVDTEEHLHRLPVRHRSSAVVVPVGAPEGWFRPCHYSPRSPVRVVFFGLYTPLQGTPVIGQAIGMLADDDLEFTMIGDGQELAETRERAGANDRVRWIDWVESERLPEMVASHDICLGIFGDGPKARRVVPNKVYQGAAAGCAVVTADTRPQRRLFDEVAYFVPPGNPNALARALSELASSPDGLVLRRKQAQELADQQFRPIAVVAPLIQELSNLSSP